MEYIEREVLRKAVRSKTMTKYDWSEEIDFEDFEKVLDGIPAADVAPVVHGRWIDKPTGKYGNWQSWCSACGKHSGIGGIQSNQHKPYCPHCGARMDGE